MSTWEQNVYNLERRGVNPELIDAIIEAGSEMTSSLVETMAANTDEQLREFERVLIEIGWPHAGRDEILENGEAYLRRTAYPWN